MPRPQTRKTSYVGKPSQRLGKLKDGKTRGFWLLLLAAPCRGRAIPCGFVTYSSRTIAQMSIGLRLVKGRAVSVTSYLVRTDSYTLLEYAQVSLRRPVPEWDR